MFARFTSLESRDVPATWHVEMLSSNPGSTDATITESLVVGTAIVTAPTANDAVSLAITGNVVVAYSGQTHTYTFGPTSTSGTGAAFRIIGSGSTTELQLEDLADMPGATPDYDYNDHTWSLNVAQTAANGDPLPEVGIEAIDPTAAEGKSPPGSSTGLFRVSRSGSTTDALTTYVRIETTAGSATNKDDYSELVLDTVTYMTGGGSTTENLYQVTFAPNETYVTIPIVPVDDSKLENDELAQLKLLSGSAYVVDATKSKALILIVDKEEKPQIVITNKDVIEATKLKVAKWHDAFQATADGENVEIKGPTTGTNYDFIDRDDDRFNVWVKDLAKWQQMETDGTTPSFQHNKVKISTTNVALFTAYNDDATAVDLVRYTGGDKGNGWFWSDSQMLVSNKVDDEYSRFGAGYLEIDDSSPSWLSPLVKHGYQWQISDRTHRIALGGTTKAEYEYLPGKSVQSEKTTKVVNVKVHGIILRETAGGAQVVSLAAVSAAFKRANEQYAQVGIRLVPNVQVKDPPVDPRLDLRNGLDEFPGLSDGFINMTPEEKALLDAADLRTAATDDIELYFVNYLSVRSLGEAFPNSLVPNQKYADSVIVSAKDATAIGEPFIEAHGIGHVLLDDGIHYTAALWPA